MTTREWLLSFDGCPYLFATAGVAPSFTSTDDSWSSDWVIARGALAYPRDNTFGYRMRPQEGTCEIDGQRFLLHDKRVGIGPAAGQLLTTYLGTRSLNLIPSTALVSVISASSTDFTVASAAVLNPAGGYAWIDNECIKYGVPVGAVVPIVARGAYGSLPTDHRSYEGLFPEVWTEFPFVARRRCILWRVTGTTAYPHWRGYLQTSVRTGSGEHSAGYEIQCESSWSWQSKLTLGIVEASARIRGIDNLAVHAYVFSTTLGLTRNFGVDTYFSGPQVRVVWNSVDEAAAALRQQLQDQLGTAVVNNTTNYIKPNINRDQGSIRYVANFRGTHTNGARIELFVGNERIVSPASDSNVGGVYTATANIPTPTVCRVFPVNASGLVEVDDVSDLPTTWTGMTTTTNGYVSSVAPVLRGTLNDNAYLVVRPSSKTNDPPSVTGVVSVAPRRPGAYSPDALGIQYVETRFEGAPSQRGINGVIITEPLQLGLVYQYRCEHWVYGLRYNIIRDPVFDTQDPAVDPPDLLASGADYRDWDWSNIGDVIFATAGAPNARELYLDGKLTLGQFVTDLCLYNGCCVGVHDSKMRIVPIRPPLPTDSVVATIRKGDYAAGLKPEYIPMPESLANSVKLESDDASLIVNDQRSQQRYGKGREIQARLNGVDNLAVLGVSPTALAQSLFKRMLGLWSEPVSLIRIPLSRKYVDAIQLGDFVRVTDDWFLPNGQGARGLNGSASAFVSATQGVGQVIEVTESTKDGTYWVGMLIFSLDGFAGYSPACHVSSISGAQLIMSRSFLTAATSTKNYDGSDPTTGDAGVSKFVAGDRVRLTVRDDVTPAFGTFIVQSVDPSTHSITLTTTPVGWAAIVAGGAWVDLTYATSNTAGLQDNQRGYAWVASEVTNTIGGTGDRAQRWAP